jgi:hypothetical protein
VFSSICHQPVVAEHCYSTCEAAIGRGGLPVNEPKKTGARGARARTSGQNHENEKQRKTEKGESIESINHSILSALPQYLYCTQVDNRLHTRDIHKQ